MKTCTKCGLPFPATEDWQTTCLLCWKASKGYDENKTDSALRSMMEHAGALNGHLADIINLCHPDRHQNSERSNKVTQWLLMQRLK